VDCGASAVTRALGDHFPKRERLGISAEPFVSPPLEIASSDTFLVIASDGVRSRSLSRVLSFMC
jgi:serine/threonine protein phosphatase PrpC